MSCYKFYCFILKAIVLFLEVWECLKVRYCHYPLAERSRSELLMRNLAPLDFATGE